MTKPTLHLLAVPHTVTGPRASHCAFTGKVKRFSPMMRALGYPVIHYGTDQAESGADEDVVVITVEEQEKLLGHKHHENAKAFVGKDANLSSPLYRQFNYELRGLLKERVKPGDIICAAFGTAHAAAISGLPIIEGPREARAWAIETGIGYPETFLPFRIYESEAWRHYHLGYPRRGGRGSDWEWVVPNYYDTKEWSLGSGRGGYVLYFGRLTDEKGLLVFAEMARRRPDLRFVMCGQGDPEYYLSLAPNLEYHSPVTGAARNSLVGEALAVVCPTRYVEPFGGVTVEAHLTGRPVLGAVYGSFTETIKHGKNGYRCRTIGDFLAALEAVEDGKLGWDSHAIRNHAREHYSLEAVGPQYARIFETLGTLAGDGYLSHESHIGPVLRAVVPESYQGNGPAFAVADAEQGTNGTATEHTWRRAQSGERSWWVGNPDRWPVELQKQEKYAALMGFPEASAELKAERMALGAPVLYDFGHARVVDFGCGPFSLLQRSKVGLGVAIDPLDFGPELENAYDSLGLTRVRVAGEDFKWEGNHFDEAWCYNCLQHVKSPSAVLAQMAAVADTIRLFEWLAIPADELHPHILGEGLFDAAFPESEWERVRWEVGELGTTELHGRYLGAVLRRKVLG